MPIPFFIFFPERSGSTFLVHMLRSHPAIRCKAEVFDKDKSPEGSRIRAARFSDEKATEGFLKALYSAPDEAAGFKFKFPMQYELYPDVFQYLLQRREQIRCIVLHRANLLKVAVSRKNLQRLRAIGLTPNLKQTNWIDLGPLRLDCSWAVQHMRVLQAEDASLLEAANPFPNRLIVRYEDLLENCQQTAADICDFLGVQRRDLTSKTLKITNDSLKDALANYDEVVAYFRGTEFEKFLDPEFDRSVMDKQDS